MGDSSPLQWFGLVTYHSTKLRSVLLHLCMPTINPQTRQYATARFLEASSYIVVLPVC